MNSKPDVFYFVRAVTVFLQNFTVLVLIFLPKMLRTLRGETSIDRSSEIMRSSHRGTVLSSKPRANSRSSFSSFNRSVSELAGT